MGFVYGVVMWFGVLVFAAAVIETPFFEHGSYQQYLAFLGGLMCFGEGLIGRIKSGTYIRW